MDKIKIFHKDGTQDNIGSIEDGRLHSTTLLNYAKEKHPSNSIFNNLDYSYVPELIGFFFLNNYNDCLFLNASKNIEKRGYKGILMVPNQLDEPQISSITNFIEKANDFDLLIMYDLTIEDGILDGKEIISSKKSNHISDINACIKYIKENNKTRKM